MFDEPQSHLINEDRNLVDQKLSNVHVFTTVSIAPKNTFSENCIQKSHLPPLICRCRVGHPSKHHESRISLGEQFDGPILRRKGREIKKTRHDSVLQDVTKSCASQ